MEGVGVVIQATGTVEFEVSLRTGALPGGYWYPVATTSCLISIQNTPQGVAPPLGVLFGSEGNVVVKYGSLSDQILTLPSSALQRY